MDAINPTATLPEQTVIEMAMGPRLSLFAVGLILLVFGLTCLGGLTHAASQDSTVGIVFRGALGAAMTYGGVMFPLGAILPPRLILDRDAFRLVARVRMIGAKGPRTWSWHEITEIKPSYIGSKGVVVTQLIPGNSRHKRFPLSGFKLGPAELARIMTAYWEQVVPGRAVGPPQAPRRDA